MTTAAQTIFESMKRIVEAPGYPLLQSYKDDFYKHDLAQLLRGWSSKSRAIWVVTPNGTYLNFVGHHAKQIESVEASLSTGYANFEIYLLSEKGVTAISRERALDEARRLDFLVKGHSLLNQAGEKLATFEIEPCGQAYRNRTCVHFTSGPAIRKDAFVLSALIEIAIQETILACSSLFSGVALVTLDGDVVFGNSLVAAQEIENSSLFALV